MSDSEDGNGAPGDNDADKRPRIYGRTSTPDGEVEFTVQGAEGETSEDVRETAEETLTNLVDSQEELADEDEHEERGIQ